MRKVPSPDEKRKKREREKEREKREKEREKGRKEEKKKEFSLAANFPGAGSDLARIHKGIFQVNITVLFH